MSKTSKILKRCCSIAVQTTLGGLILGCTLSKDFSGEADRNLIAPWRNYHMTLVDHHHFRTEDDMIKFFVTVGAGWRNFFNYTLSGFSQKFEVNN